MNLLDTYKLIQMHPGLTARELTDLPVVRFLVDPSGETPVNKDTLGGALMALQKGGYVRRIRTRPVGEGARAPYAKGYRYWTNDTAEPNPTLSGKVRRAQEALAAAEAVVEHCWKALEEAEQRAAADVRRKEAVKAKALEAASATAASAAIAAELPPLETP